MWLLFSSVKCSRSLVVGAPAPPKKRPPPLVQSPASRTMRQYKTLIPYKFHYFASIRHNNDVELITMPPYDMAVNIMAAAEPSAFHSSRTRCPGPSIFPRRRPPLWQINQAPALLSSAAQRVLEPRRARRRARPRAPALSGARAALGVRGRPPHITVRVFVTRRSVVIVGLTCRRSAALSCRRVFSLLTAARGASPRERASR